MQANKKSIILEVGIVVLLVAAGVYGGFKWGQGPPSPPIDTHKIDSLNNIVLTLEDSIRGIQGKKETITKTIIKYRTRYDSIYLRDDSREIIESLRKTAARPIK